MPTSIKNELYAKMPEELRGLVDLAFNLWWSWDPDARLLFKKLDPPLWYRHDHNVVQELRDISEQRLEKMAQSESFMSLFRKVYERFRSLESNKGNCWYPQTYPQHADKPIAYLSMEYGLHNSVRIYSGGLGILSGDHVKECSDLGIPLVAVGFLYEEGYFTQKIPLHGWQEAIYRETDFNGLPITEVADPQNPDKPLLVPINFNDIIVWVRIWQIEVGTLKLYLMDSNINENPPWDRDLTDRLYGGSQELRMKQEMILGIGAVRLFEKLGIEPAVWHLNEGHCSFSSVERIYRLMRDGMEFSEAVNKVRQNTIFTTHTPVPAGHDVFPFQLIDTYFNTVYIAQMGREHFFGLGYYDFGSSREPGFNMTALGMRTAKWYNGVAKLHREVSYEMFKPLWEELESKYGDDYEPLTYVTNGVHIPSFASETFQEMFNMVDEKWVDHHDDPDYWRLGGEMMEGISDSMIWEYHKAAKERMFKLFRETARNRRRSGDWDCTLAMVNGVLLDPSALTIGFARRFATYKRANLIFSDFERVQKILNNEYRPVQLVFAGKAHPADDAGKKLIQEIVQHSKNPDLGHRVSFIEDYGLVIAKMLLQGVDVWLNNPYRPNEASGTSGMKAAANFVPNLSILDGWWAEGYNGENGWAINPDNSEFEDWRAQNWHDAKSLYDILENEVIPTYYDRDANGVPVKWVKMMREAMRTALPQFSARRMLKDYSRKLYTKAIENNNH